MKLDQIIDYCRNGYPGDWSIDIKQVTEEYVVYRLRLPNIGHAYQITVESVEIIEPLP